MTDDKTSLQNHTPEQQADQQKSAEQYVVVNDLGLNLRQGPAKSFKVVSVLKDGTLLEAVQIPAEAAVPGWILVIAGNKHGWVDARFCRKVEA